MSNLTNTQKEFIAGLAGGTASVLVCHPLDVARTMMNIMATPGANHKTGYETFSQTLKTIYQKEHWHGFYKGTNNLKSRSEDYHYIDPAVQLHLLPNLFGNEEAAHKQISADEDAGRTGQCLRGRSHLGCGLQSALGSPCASFRLSARESWCRCSALPTNATRRRSRSRC